MLIEEFDEISISKAKTIHETLKEIKPYLGNLKEEYEEADETDDGEIQKLNSGELTYRMRIEGADSEPSIDELNLTLGFLAYKDAIDIKGDHINQRSPGDHTDFFPSSYDHERAEDLFHYLKEKIDEEGEVENPRSGYPIINLEDFDPDEAYEEVC